MHQDLKSIFRKIFVDLAGNWTLVSQLGSRNFTTELSGLLRIKMHNRTQVLVVLNICTSTFSCRHFFVFQNGRLKAQCFACKKQCPLFYRWKHSDITYSRLGGDGKATGLQQLLFHNESSISILRCQCFQFPAFMCTLAWLFTSHLSYQWQLIESQSSHFLLCFLLCSVVVRAIGFLFEVSAIFQYKTFKLSIFTLS